MKTKPLVCVLMVFFVVVLSGVYSIADDKEKFGFYVPKLDEEIYGTWINADYRRDDQPSAQKSIFYDWGYSVGFCKITDTFPIDKWTFIIVDKWSDYEGNIWYDSLFFA